MIYLNEFDTHAAEWLRELSRERLIPEAFVDDRSIKEVEAKDLEGYDQCHFFAGIGGWSEALRLAGWPESLRLWTGSCPCQPFSSAGKGEGINDERHLWPEFFRLIQACRPQFVFGEQVCSADVIGTQLEADFLAAVQALDFMRANRLADRIAERERDADLATLPPRWLDGICADLASAGYAVRAGVLGAHSVGAPHQRQRLYWVAYATGSGCAGGMPGNKGCPQRAVQGRGEADGRQRGRVVPAGGGHDGAMVDADGPRREPGQPSLTAIRYWGSPGPDDRSIAVGDTEFPRLEGLARDGDDRHEPGRIGAGAAGSTAQASDACGLGDTEGRGQPVGGDASQPWGGRHALGAGWSRFDTILCRDGKHRRIPAGAQPAVQPVVDGVPVTVDELWGSGSPVDRFEEGYPLTLRMPGRVGLLRGAGNAIVPQVAAVFIKDFMDWVGIVPQGVNE